MTEIERLKAEMNAALAAAHTAYEAALAAQTKEPT